MPALTRLFGILAPCCSLLGAVPAATRPIRRRSVAGLSTGAATLGLLCTQLWFTYGLMLHDAPQISTNGIWAIVKTGLMLAIVCSTRAEDRARVAGVAALTTLGGLALIPMGSAAVGGVAAVLTIVAAVPQVVLTLRHGAGAGLSRGAVLFSVCGSTSWTVYGLSRGDAAVFWCSLWAACLNGVLLAAASTEPGALLRRGRRRFILAMHVDAIVVRRLTQARPELARSVAARVPVLADGIRDRHRRLHEHLATGAACSTGALAA